ncbi:hypothetical protein MIR68_007433 [Amoeboaphelidium protococcarum]|nr:hypothetical protein MIR68_007433 [Amoeboaphelidium protococcarum]KAI3642687.1 hypothetical protein MP228_012242 [Amoeboaphelidium protococcarum]KAI3645467.1 hypothetical protein MP228_008395 [Amoeboaphelidium protococcarum]
MGKDDIEVEINMANMVPIAHPFADQKLTKKLFKVVKKATKAKHVKRGVKEVVKAIRKGEKGVVCIAGDVSPVDVISHLPLLCEDADIPYCYVYSKSALGAAGLSKKSTSVIMVAEKSKAGTDYEEYYDSCVKAIKAMPILPSHLAAAQI